MKGPGGAGVLVGVIAGALFLLGDVSWAQPPGSIPPVYVQRLRMPVRGDGFAQPRAVVADLHTGEIFVCDSLRNRIVIFDEQGRFRYEIPGGSTFQAPIDLAVDPEGYLFVLGQVSGDVALLDFDGRFIRRVSLTGLPPDAESPRFSSLAISPGGESLYLMDPENDRLWIADRDGAVRGSIDMTVGRPQEEIDQLRYGHIDVYARHPSRPHSDRWAGASLRPGRQRQGNDRRQGLGGVPDDLPCRRGARRPRASDHPRSAARLVHDLGSRPKRLPQ